MVLKKDAMSGKGKLNNRITSIIFEYLENNGLKSHFIKQLTDTEQLVESVKIIPLEVVVRNIAAGSITQDLDLKKDINLMRHWLNFSIKMMS